MRIQRALPACVLLFLGCARAPSMPAKSEATPGPLTAEQEGFRHLLGRGCTGFKECDDLYIKTRRRAADCAEISSLPPRNCTREREDLATATKLRDDGFELASQEEIRHRFILAGEAFRRALALGCGDDDDCQWVINYATSRTTECADLSLDCTSDRENEIVARALWEAEQKCRATPACIGPRLVKLICAAKAETEVDPDELEPLQARYAAAIHKPFNDKLCAPGKTR